MKCQNDHCNDKVSFFIDDGTKKVKILRLFFVREDESAYVHCNQQFRSLCVDGILLQVAPVTVYLKPPAIPEPTQRVFPQKLS